MARARRFDAEGVNLHFTNRGGAKRTTFEVRADFRCFEACLAPSVRREEILVHSFVLQTSHFHLLRRHGCISEVMWRIQKAYVRDFNRSRRRDSLLFSR